MAGIEHGDEYDVDNDDEAAAYVWEAPLERNWEEIKEDEKGRLKSIAINEQRARKAKLKDHAQSSKLLEKGMIRYLCVIVDKSGAMDAKDLKPNRKLVTAEMVELFLKEFFDQNPISQVSIVAAQDRVAKKLTELSGNPQHQMEIFRSKSDEGGGEFSLQNSLDLACEILRGIPFYGTREVVVIMGSLTTTDPGDIHETIKALQREKIRVSFVSLSAEVYICKNIAQSTAGLYSVALNKTHYKEILFQHVPPSPISKKQRVQRKWIRMGFPQQRFELVPSLCACHQQFKYSGYHCPRCHSKFCELPTECNVCSLTLVSSPHLARSYHHLCPIQPYFEVASGLDSDTRNGAGAAPSENAMAASATERREYCYSCQQHLSLDTSICVQCPQCLQQFCVDCDIYIHESLHNCPGCLSTQLKVRRSDGKVPSSTGT